MVADGLLPSDVQNRVLRWIVDVSPGAAAETMAHWLAFGLRRRRGIAYPETYADMSQCLSLFKHAPELEKDFSKMASLSPEWSIIVKNWDFVRSAQSHHIRELIERELENHPGHGVSTVEKQPEGRG